MLILAPVNLYKSVFESKFEPINTSYCYLKHCLLLWAMGEGERDQGIAGASKGRLENETGGADLTLVQTTSMRCLLWAWQMTGRGEGSLQCLCRPAVTCRPKAMLDEVTWQGHFGPGLLLFARAWQQGRGETCLPHFPATGIRKSRQSWDTMSFTQPGFESGCS